MKKYKVTLYYHTSVTVVVEAENEDKAVEIAYDKACDAEYNDEFNMNAQEDGTPDVEEIEDSMILISRGKNIWN